MIKAAVKILAITLWAVLVMFLAYLFKLARRPALADKVMCFCARGVLHLAEVRFSVQGSVSGVRPLLVVSNHVSYLDVLLLSTHKMLRYTPKSEIQKWPFFGWVCRVQGSIFIDRRAGKIKTASDGIRDALAAGQPICLFPEATTGNGLHLLPFKSSFFSLGEHYIDGKPLYVQPVALRYARIRNLPISTTQWPDIAWYGDMDLVPHLWNFLKIAPISVEVIFLPPVNSQDFADRKTLSAHCKHAIAHALEVVN